MGFANYADLYVIDEVATSQTAEWQLVVETPEGVSVIYLSATDDLAWWKKECVRLFGVWPSVFEKGNFVEVRGG